MGWRHLATLAESYPAQDRDSLRELACEYGARNEHEVLELAALAADVSVDSVVNLGLEPEANPQLLEAFRLQYPNVDTESLRGRAPEEIEGFVNGVKGKYFEVLVRDRLNAGERVGEIELDPGQTVDMAESPAQEGWDLVIKNPDGTTHEDIQLKATESLYYVKRAFERYPGIRVATTSEIDGTADNILQTDISNEQLTEATRELMGELGESMAENILDTGLEMAADSVPLLSPLVIVGGEGRNVLMGRSTLDESLRRGAKRLGKAGMYNAIGAALTSTGIGVAAVPVVAGMKIAERRVTARAGFSKRLEARTAELKNLD